VSIVEIKCPRCGSACSKAGSSSNEYTCSHCGSVFRLMDDTKRTVTTDVVIRGCLFCGKPLDSGKGFKCTRCGREYFCESCVDLVREKYVCIECISKANENCQLCRKYVAYTCVSCGRRACKAHRQHMGFSMYSQSSFDGRPTQVEIVLFCPHCYGFICSNCAKHTIFSGTRCPKCDSVLTEYSPYR
jgi:hypothetical protein